MDIDNDGDLDCFSMHRVPYYDSVKVYYFRNDGSATAPNYTEVSGSANPLDSMNLYNYNLSGMWPGSCSFQFVDIDNDSDYDVYISKGLNYPTSGYRGIYFENTGSSSSPVFNRKMLSQTPLPNVKATCIVDFDKDGDMDILGSNNGYGQTLEYWENTGTASLSQFPSASSPTLNTPLDSIKQMIQDLNGLPSTVNNYIETGYLQCADIDGDGDIDVFSAIMRDLNGIDSFDLFFYENLDTTITTNTTSLVTEDDLTIFPNPT